MCKIVFILLYTCCDDHFEPGGNNNNNFITFTFHNIYLLKISVRETMAIYATTVHCNIIIVLPVCRARGVCVRICACSQQAYLQNIGGPFYDFFSTWDLHTKYIFYTINET